MKRAIDPDTNDIVRGIITTIRTKFNCSKEGAENLFRRNVMEVDVIEKLFDSIEDDIQDQKEMLNSLKDA